MKLEAKAGTVLTLGEWMHGVYAEELENVFKSRCYGAGHPPLGINRGWETGPLKTNLGGTR